MNKEVTNDSEFWPTLRRAEELVLNDLVAALEDPDYMGYDPYNHRGKYA